MGGRLGESRCVELLIIIIFIVVVIVSVSISAAPITTSLNQRKRSLITLIRRASTTAT